MRGRRAALLDRDGTINIDHGYVGRPEDVELLPHVAQGLRWLQDEGYDLVVVTNQSGIHRGYFGMADVEAVHRRVSELLAASGVKLVRYYVCPHGPDSGCGCRKPLTGLAERAAAELGLDLTRSLMIGDKESDVELGIAVGAYTVRLAPHGVESRANIVSPDWLHLLPLLKSTEQQRSVGSTARFPASTEH